MSDLESKCSKHLIEMQDKIMQDRGNGEVRNHRETP